MKTLGQIAFEVCWASDLWPDMDAQTHEDWEAIAQAVRTAVIEECVNWLNTEGADLHDPAEAMTLAESLRGSLK